MITHFSFFTRRPFFSPRDPGFLRDMTPIVSAPRRRHRSIHATFSLKRASIFTLAVFVLFASSYPATFVAAATENALTPFLAPSSRPLQEWGLKNADSYVPGEVVVQFREGTIDLAQARGVGAARTFAARKRFVVKEMIEGVNVSVLKTQKSESVEQMIERLKNDPAVAAVQPNFQYQPMTIDTDDTHRGLLWGLDNTGQEILGRVGVADADMDAPEAWGISQGADDVITAVIDTGVAYNHPDLLPNMWDGTNCKDENGNTLGGCNHGYDYEDNDKTPLPTRSEHGTHIAGTIAAAKNNGRGVIGIAPRTKIMALKTSLSTFDNVKSIQFAKQNGAKVINASWGASSFDCSFVFDELLYDAIRDFPGLFIAAAGNRAREHNGTTYVDMPADYGHDTGCWQGLPNVVNVAATDNNDDLAFFSDYGSQFVDVGAPGYNIYSTIYTEQRQEAPITTENFDVAIPPAVPQGWTGGGETNNTWGTETVNNSVAISSTLTRLPYADNADTTLRSPTYNLGSMQNARMAFDIRCETEYDALYWVDYLVLEMSPDGKTFTPIARFDEWLLDRFIGDNDPDNASQFVPVGGPIFSEFLTDAFQYRFRWITNGIDNNHEGCSVDNIAMVNVISVITDGSEESYDYMSGTSMAAPHVTGLAALIFGANPLLSAAQVKEKILATGDAIPALAGKTVTGRRVNAAKALASFGSVNFTLGFTSDNIIPAAAVQQRTDGSGVVRIPFRVKGDLAGVHVQLKNFEYSTDGGTTWRAPTNGDASGALSLYQQNSYFTVADYNGPASSLTLATEHPDVADLNNASGMQVRVRFKAYNSTTETPFAESEAFAIDNVIAPLVVTNPSSSIITVNADTFTITGNAEANADVFVKLIAPPPSGPGPGISGWGQQLSNGATDFSITVSLVQDVGNVFRVTATDAVGNATDAVQLTILEDSTAVATAVVSVGGDTTMYDLLQTNDTTPDVVIVGEENMQCRWDTMDTLYAQMPSEQSLTVTGDRANVTLLDQSSDGFKTVFVSCIDAVGNEQTLENNLDITFVIDTTAPETFDFLVEPDPTKVGVVTVQFGLSGTGGTLDGNVLPVVTITGLKSSYTVTYLPQSPPSQEQPPEGMSLRDDPPPEPPPGGSTPAPVPAPTPPSTPSYPPPATPGGGGGSIGVPIGFPFLQWTGTFILLDEDEEATATVVISGVKDAAGNEIAPNTVVGTFQVDTLAPTPLLIGLPVDPDTSVIPSLDVTVGGTDVVEYKYKFDDGEYSDVLTPDVHITRTTLLNGLHTLSVIGRDTIGNWQDETQATTYTWTVNDTTPPDITGLTNDATPTKVKYWDWDSSDSSAQFRFTVAKADDLEFGGSYSDVKTTAQADETGTFYLYVQAKDNNGNESAVVKVSAVLDNAPPVITLHDDEAVQVYQGTVYTDFGATALDNIDGDVTAKMVTTGSVDTTTVGTYAMTYTVADILGNASEKTRIVTVLELKAEEVVLAPETTITEEKSDIVIGDNYDEDAIVHIPANVEDAHLDMSALVESASAETKSAELTGAITVNAATVFGTVHLALPAKTEITAPAEWTGIVNAPQVKETSSVTIPLTDGRNSIASSVIEVGADAIPLTLNKAARLVMPGQAGKRGGYTRGALFTPMTTKCSADTQAAGDALPAEGDCTIDVGGDLVIWTKHFTRFVSYFLGRGVRIVENPSSDSVGIAFVEGATTEKRDVTLTFTYGGDVAEMAVSNFSDFRGAHFVPAVRRLAWTLDDGDGEKTVYALFRNDDGGTTTKSARITVLPRVVAAPAAPTPAVSIPTPIVEAPTSPAEAPSVPAGAPRVLGVESTNIVALEKQRVASVDRRLTLRMKGKVLAYADVPDVVWYVDPLSLQKFAVSDSTTAFRTLERFGLGIRNADLAKIPLSTDTKAKAGAFSRRLLGRILIQVESRGEAWYVNPEDGKRYYVANGAEAYQLMQSLRKDLPPADFRKISVGDLG